MKTFFLIASFFLSFIACKTENGSQTEFKAITLDLSGLGIEIDDTTFSVNNFNFNIYRTVSSNPGSIDEYDSNDGILLAYPDRNLNPSTLELDLSSVKGLSKITISMFNNCGHQSCTVVQTLNRKREVLQELNDNLKVPIGSSEVLIENINSSISALKISSFETTVYSIKLE